MYALTFEGPRRVVVSEVPKPVVADPGDAIVRVTTTSISPADLERYTAPDPSSSITPGGACSGVIESTGKDVRRWRLDDPVVVPAATSIAGQTAVLGRDLPGSHAGWLRVPAADHNLAPLPDPLNFEAQAVVAAETYATAARAARLLTSPRSPATAADSSSVPGLSGRGPGAPTVGSVCLIGCGPTGLAFISACKSLASSIPSSGALALVAVDAAPGRVMLARRLGALAVVLRAGAPARADEVRKRAGRTSFGAVVVGPKIDGADIELALELAAPGALMIMLDNPGTGWSGDRMPAGARQVRTVVAGYPAIAEIEAHLRQLQAGSLDLLPLISHTFPLAEAAAAFQLALEKGRGVSQILLKP